MQPYSSEDNDLQTLGVAAQRQIDRKTQQQDTRQQPRQIAGLCLAAWLKLLAGAILLLWLWSNSQTLVRTWLGVSAGVAQAQSEAILKAARTAIEQHHKATGQWPQQVPLPALDALVTMERHGADYQLSVTLDGRGYSMDSSGNFDRK